MDAACVMPLGESGYLHQRSPIAYRSTPYACTTAMTLAFRDPAHRLPTVGACGRSKTLAGPERAATSRFGFVLTHAVAISAEGVIVAIGVDEATSAEQGHDHDAHDLPLRISADPFRSGPNPVRSTTGPSGGCLIPTLLVRLAARAPRATALG